MPQPSDLQRNSTGYIFSRPVPGALRGLVGSERITRDLATDELKEARQRCWIVGVQVDRFFESLQVEISRLTAGAQEFLWRWRLTPIEELPADWADIWFRNKMPQPLFATRPQTKLVPAAAAQEQPATAAESAALLSEVLEVWKGEHEGKHLASTLSARPIRRFIEFLGDRPIAQVEAKDIPRFLDAMRQMPSRPLRGAKRGTVHELMQHPEGAKRPRLSEGSIGDYRRALNSYFQWAVAFGHITRNPVHAILVRRHRAIYTPRQPFTSQELNLFFSSSAYLDGVSGANRRTANGALLRHFLHWMPLLGLFTGARLSELAYLVRDDVCEDDGTWYLYIRPNATGRHLKSQAAVRIIPLHPTLHDVGFLEFVRGRNKDEWIFPEVRGYGANPHHNVSVRLNGVIRSAGLPESNKTFHCFRHAFKQACRLAEIAEEVHDALSGHSIAPIGRRYGLYPLKLLDAAMRKVEFSGLDLRHLMKQ